MNTNTLRTFGLAILMSGVSVFGAIQTTAAAPATGAKITGAKTSKKATTKTVYVCSMHPKVVSTKPGKCPICKMALKKK